MKKNYSKISHVFFNFMFFKKTVFVFLILLLSTTNFVAQTYCNVAATSAIDDDIFNVSLGSLNNTSNCSSLGGVGSVVNKYNNYTGVAAPVLFIGSNYPLSVTIGICGSTSYSGRFGVWIDYNQNGLFTDPGENVYMSAYTPFAVAGTAVSAPGGITIPLTATSGITRMRVVETESSTAPGPCTNPTWGEVEDYNVNIIMPTPLDLGVSAFLKPLGTKVCYATDTIIATVKNFGTAVADFSITPAVLTILATGPSAATYTLALNSGTIATNASQNYTISTSYDLSNIGTYKLKGYTTVAGDGLALNDTTSLIITRSPFFTTSVSPNDTVCLGVPIQLNANYKNSGTQIGVGTTVNGSSSYPTPYGHYYGGAKHQFLYLASELAAAGVTAGNINGLSFNITNLNSVVPLTDYNIAISSTSISAITSIQTIGFSTYFSSASYAPVLGTNTHSFSTPFIWDGISNIIIETCFNNNDTGPSGGNASVSQSSTTFTSSIWYRSDNNPTVCSSTLSTSAMKQRPNTWFIQPAIISYSWSPAFELSTSNIANPIANITSSRTYTVSGTLKGCMTYDTIRIYVKPAPMPNLGADTTCCTFPVIINSNITAGSYLWNNNTTASSLSIVSAGKYWVTATGTNGCAKSDTILVSLGSFPIVTLGPDTAYCQGSTINLYAGFGVGNIYDWSNGSTASSIIVGTSGTYSVNVTNAYGCKSSDAINITSKVKPSVSLVFGGKTTFCPYDAVGRPLTEGLPLSGNYIGAGVLGNTFFADQAGQGTHIILYNYTGPNGCSNIAKDTLTVNACVGIDELTEEFVLNIYPNPNSGMFSLELTTGSEINGNISILSIDGKLVFNDLIKGTGFVAKFINISELADGIYYLKLETKTAVKTYKILKQ